MTKIAKSQCLHTPAGHRLNRRLRVADAHLGAVLAGAETLLFDGAMGTQLQAAGLAAGELPELLNLTNPQSVTAVHAAYVAAGAEAITTNTFGANAAKLGDAASVADVVSAGVACARAAGARYVAADIGPTGALLKPLGTLSFDDAYRLFAEQVIAAAAAGADLFVIETMADLAEAKAALLAVQENSALPAFVTMTFDADGRTFLGTTPEIAAVTLSALGADAVGINCSLGPTEVAPLVYRMLPHARCPVMVQANAGLPTVVDGVTTYTVTPEAYCDSVAKMLDRGVTIIGGCCGTTPEFTAAEAALLAARTQAGRHMVSGAAGAVPAAGGVPAAEAPAAEAPAAGAVPAAGGVPAAEAPAAGGVPAAEAPAAEAPAAGGALTAAAGALTAAGTAPAAGGALTAAGTAPAAGTALTAAGTAPAAGTASATTPATNSFTVASAQQLLELTQGDIGIIGERINPTGKAKLKEALRSGNHDYVMSEAIAQERAGAQVLDVNAGLPEIDERATILRLVDELAGVTTLPLQIDSSDPIVIEAAVRGYPGKPIINSCNGSAESLATMLPIAGHYGCAIVGLTLDEDGIPATSEGRLTIARRIVAAAEELGIPRCDIAIDCLAMAASTDQRAPRQILEAIRLVKSELIGVRTVLGVSNISFGLPCRPLINATFLAAAFAAGLDLAIINPMSVPLADTVCTWRVLSGEDVSAQSYVASYAGRKQSAPSQIQAGANSALDAPSVSLPRERSDAQESSLADPQRGNAPDSAAPQRGNATDSLANEIRELIIAGRKDAVAHAVTELLAQTTHSSRATEDDASPSINTTNELTMRLINETLIPSLDEVGARFEAGTFFLPQLMASAEAAKAGFDVLREQGGAAVATKGAIVLATVKGDIHDIGKNIVRMLLENYGYEVHDLGRDVDPSAVVEAVVAKHVQLCGLSALMTTTVPAMAKTIELLREQAPWCKVVVGGAVLNPEYAEMVGADYYAKDAAATAHIAAEVLG